MTDNSFGQIIQETDKLSRVGGTFNGDDNNDSNSISAERNGEDKMNDLVIEKALHNLLTETNDHFAESESLDIHANQQSKSQDHSIADNTNTDRGNMVIDKVTNEKNVSTDLDSIIENVIISMNANQALINNIRNLNNNFTNNIHINQETPFILENILHDQDNPTISFDLDNLDFTNTFFHGFSNNDNNVISNSNITSTGVATVTNNNNNNHKDNNLKRKLDNTDIDFQEFGKRAKSSKTDISNSKEPPLLSPASLSPMSSLSTDNNELKTNELDNENSRNITNKDSDNTTNLNNNTNNNKIHEIPNDLIKNNRNTPSTSKNNHHGKNRYTLNSITKSAYSPQSFTHKKLTNEYTMHQISEMKKRIINTHKLLLNFNFLKDSYAKTCIELKKSLNALRDSELHRAHLLLENETLKAKLLELKSCKNDQS